MKQKSTPKDKGIKVGSNKIQQGKVHKKKHDVKSPEVKGTSSHEFKIQEVYAATFLF
jgi:hypothetical protein